MAIKIKKIQNHGFIVDPIEDKEYLFGQNKLATVVLQPDRDWTLFLPEVESQNKNGLETSNCTNYGTLNCIEILMRRLFGKNENYSERFTGVMTKTAPLGNSIQNVVETIKNICGLILEELLPFDESIRTWEQYYSPNPMTPVFLSIGKQWLMNYSLRHEWIFTDKDGKDRIVRLKECLQYSPIGVSVSAWTQDEKGIYIKEPGDKDNHWVCCYGYEDNQYWKIFDSYDNSFKRLAWDYDFSYAKRFTITKNNVSVEKLSLIAFIYNKMVEILKKIIILQTELNQKIKGFFKGRNNK